MGKPGTCLFKLSILLAIPPILACLAIYFVFGGPPPTVAADVGIKVLLITSIVQAIMAIICIVSLSSDVKSICSFFICDLGLLLVFGSCIYMSFTLQDIKLPIKCMTHYTQAYFRENGDPPPFLETVQSQLGCCGINGVHDYISPIMAVYQQRGHLSDSDAYTIPNSCCPSEDRNLRAKCKLAKESYVHSLMSSPGRDESPSLRAIASDAASPTYLPVRDIHENNAGFTQSLHVHKRGCGKILNSTEDFMAALPNNYWQWALLPLQLKNGYLRLMVIWSAFLLALFNYRAIQSRRSVRRPALVPRAPPRSYDNQVGQYPLLPTDGLDISINVAPQHKREMSNHPFMLSAMVNPRVAVPRDLPISVVRHTLDPNNNGPETFCPRCAAMNSIDNHSSHRHCNNSTAPSAPPPPYPFP